MVILGFSGFGLMALPLGVMADSLTLNVTLASMGVVVLAITAVFCAVRYPPPWPSRHHRDRLTDSGRAITPSSRRRAR